MYHFVSFPPFALVHLLTIFLMQMEYEVVEEIIYGLESGILFGYPFSPELLLLYILFLLFMVHNLSRN